MTDRALYSMGDGARIAYKSTPAATDPKAVVILQLGTLSEPSFGDLMAETFSAAGITTYAVASRTSGAANFRRHAYDLDQVVERARDENPGLPIAVMGVSLGAATALEWSALYNVTGVPVAAMSPVVMSRLSYLGPKPLSKIFGGFFLRRVAAQPVASPLSAGIRLTTNPASAEYDKRDPSKTVPASLFDDVMRMIVDVTLHSMAESALHPRKKLGPLLVVRAGHDAVAYNFVTGIWSHVFNGRKVSRYTARGAAHDLSQETNHRPFVQKLTQWTLSQTAGRQLA